ncbi:MAG: hypothetical protein Q9198_010747 [Flavoplaca austrocitrina]
MYGLRVMYLNRTLGERSKAFEQLALNALKLEDRHGARNIAGEIFMFHGRLERAFGEAHELWSDFKTKSMNLVDVGKRAGREPLRLLRKPIKYLANKVQARCFQWLETELRVLRLSWCDLQRLSSERSRPFFTRSPGLDAAAIKSFQKGVREATDKAGRAVEDLQHLEDWAKKVHYEIITYQES